MDTPTKRAPNRSSSGRSSSGSASGERHPLLGGLRLVRRLGAGGMGTVWLGHDEQLGVSRAVKVLPESADPELRLRFRREAEAMARVDDHPNVVRVHAAGEENGWAYLVMDLAPGGDLDARLRKGPLAPMQVVALGIALARALAHVHAKGVLHRDLKPANVLFDESGAPRIVDFGLARLSGRDRLTQTGAVVGTPTHMAPEQALGLPMDARTDVFGLGAVLWHALTGRAPVDEGPLTAMLADVIEWLPPRPSTLVPGVPAALEAVVMRALARAPEDRFASAEAFARALEALVPGNDRAPSPSPRSVLPLVVAAVASLVVAVGALVVARPRDQDSEPRPAGGEPRPTAPTTVGAPTSATDALPLGALHDALVDDDAPRGLATLEQACAGDRPLDPEAVAWAAGLLLLSDDVEQARRWSARAPEGARGRWLRAAARVGARERPERVDEADVALQDLEAAMRALDGLDQRLMPTDATDALRPVTALQRAAENLSRRAAGGAVGLAAGVMAQRRLCALYPELIELVHGLTGYPDVLAPVLTTLEAAAALVPGSRPGLGLRVVATSARLRSRAPEELREQVDALPAGGRYGWVHGVFGGAWLACVPALTPVPDDAELEQVRLRWRAFEALVSPEGLLGPGPPTLVGGRLKTLMIHASNWRSEAFFRRLQAVNGTPAASAAQAEAFAAALDNPRDHHMFIRHQARLHLFAGDLPALDALLAASSASRAADWFEVIEIERAIGAGDVDALRERLARVQRHAAAPLWRAVLAAFEGRHADAEALLAPFDGNVDILMAPWRNLAATSGLVRAIKDGRWRPEGRPYFDEPR